MSPRARILLVILLALGAFSVLPGRTRAYREGPPPDRVGACGFGAICWDGGCHATYPVGSPTLSWGLSVAAPVPGPLPQVYVPGAAYDLRLDVTDTDPNVSVIGFEIAAISRCPAVLPGGDLAPADPLRAQRRTGMNGVVHLCHTCCPGDDPACCGYMPPGAVGQNSWDFRWTAPPRGTGDVIFHAAFNSANWDGTPDFDRITLGEVTVREETCPPPVADLRVRRAACDPAEPGVEKIEILWPPLAGDILRSARSAADLALPRSAWTPEPSACVPREPWTLMFWSVGRTCELGSEAH